ncbi:FAD dependent oxidoreductase [Naematelia encephala]|uniref:FAD dependent oxidoreductase n=1 Tax=Naematelia encephala TaxID=71784 RepID=A0A1Y2AZ99_9TREE|nr:FAD dependent oxidoreductase [Naematelia encephala]
MSDPSQSILIVGAGAFGLSTALFLARKGYKDVTVIDRVPLDKSAYSPDKGCDGASADINKIFRTGYGDRKVYEELALKALPIWKEWTKTVQESDISELPKGLSPDDELLTLCGFMRLGKGKQISEHQQASMEAVIKAGRRDRVFLLKDENDTKRAAEADTKDPRYSRTSKLRRFNNLFDGDVHGVLDMDSGFNRADKACLWAWHLCRLAGVKFILDATAGRFESFIYSDKLVLGVKTGDNKEHLADKTIVACGGWTASIVPAAVGLLETTAGSVCFVDLPEDRPDLREKFGPEQFCPWSCQLSASAEGEGHRVGGFPADPSGRMKFGFRAVKFTNYEKHPVTGASISVPRTKYTHTPIDNVPKQAIGAVKNNIMWVYPELKDIGITGTKLCWYTDSIDNHFVADYVPNTNDTLFIASGGSGHGFKFLPVLGEHFVNQLEKRPDQFTPFWKWRTAKPGDYANGLREGEDGPRVLNKAQLATKEDWKFT